MREVSGLWRRLRGSLWFLPATLTLAAALLALLTLWLDRNQTGAGLDFLHLAFTAGSDGARGVLGTIAGSIITVTGVVFSITIVALQLASTQFTPRVLRSFTEDRANQLVLGVFIGTFTYSLLILRAVRSKAEDYDRFVPDISVTVALVLCLVSIGFLIFFINHIARSIQAEVIIERVTRDALRVVDDLFPQNAGTPAAAGMRARRHDLPGGSPASVTAGRSGYLQGLDEPGLLRLAEDNDLVVHMEAGIGAFVLDTDTLAVVWPASCPREVLDSLRSTFAIGGERTNEQDVSRGLIELTDIAVRALSPSINDPTTAVVCIDRITEVLAALGTRDFPDTHRLTEDGRLRFIATQPSFDEVALPTYSQIRHHGGGDPVIATRLVQSLARLSEVLPESRRAFILEEAAEVIRDATRRIASVHDLRRFSIAAQQALRSQLI